MAEKKSDATPKRTAISKPAATKAGTAKTSATVKPAAKAAAAEAAATKPATNRPAATKATTTVAPLAALPNGTETGAKTSTGSESLRDQASAFKGKASDKAREYADTGKDKAAELLDTLSRTVKDLAGTVDERLGANYGDYTRKAADAVSSAAETLKAKDVDDIVADTREFVRTRPAVAIGAAAAVGFLLARLVKAGSGDREDS